MHICKKWSVRVEKALSELHKNATCPFEQILKAAFHKTVAVQLLASHLTNLPRVTKHAHQWWRNYWPTNKWHSFWNPAHGYASVCRRTRTYTLPLCGQWMNAPKMTSQEWWMSQGTQCYQLNQMIYIKFNCCF